MKQAGVDYRILVLPDIRRRYDVEPTSDPVPSYYMTVGRNLTMIGITMKEMHP